MNNVASRIKGSRVASSLLVLVTLFVGILLGTVVERNVKGATRSGVDSADAAPLQIPAPKQLSTAFSTIAKQMEPAVVMITTETGLKQAENPQRRQRGQTPRGDQNDPFQDFFNHMFPGQGGGDDDDGSPFGGNPFGGGGRERALGSGVIVDSKGYIITNNHVVNKADRIRVKLMDDPPGSLGHDAKLIGTDAETDLAVIKIDTNKPLPAAKLGNSDSLQVGEWVLAIGSPFELEESVTAGIISSKQRDIDRRRQFQRFIQTDAAINPGNSGGPLVNMDGQVVGINTAIYTQSAGYQGVGFAMPANTVAEVYNQLIGPEHKVTRGSIGVSFNAEMNPAITKMYGGGKGVVIASVKSGGPSDNAGLKIGDAIIGIDGKEITNGDELVNIISSKKPGTNVKVSYLRNGKEQSTNVTVGDRAKLYADRLGGDTEDESQNDQPVESKMGVTVRSITPDIADRLQIPANKGVMVQDVRPGSFAEDIGLSRGDVILEVNKKPVNSEDDFKKVQGTLKSGDDVVFLVRQGRGRNADTIFLAGTMP